MSQTATNAQRIVDAGICCATGIEIEDGILGWAHIPSGTYCEDGPDLDAAHELVREHMRNGDTDTVRIALGIAVCELGCTATEAEVQAEAARILAVHARALGYATPAA